MENEETNLLRTMDEGLRRLLETDDFGIIAEGNVADYLKGQHCELYSVGHLNDRSYAFGFPKGAKENVESGTCACVRACARLIRRMQIFV